MKHLLLVLALVSPSACGEEKICRNEITYRPKNRMEPCYLSQLSHRIHPTLEPLVSLFSADALDRDVPCYHTLTIGFIDKLPKNVDEHTIGYCMQSIEVRMLKPYWEAASATERLTLLYHELGHCALGLEHHDDDYDIMNSFLLHETIAEKEWDELVNKMFRRVKK
jgi:hypothetical protein